MTEAVINFTKETIKGDQMGEQKPIGTNRTKSWVSCQQFLQPGEQWLLFISEHNPVGHKEQEEK